ncbi:hypothetical protein EDD21DRAFT_443201 [Dissophora ornata]|nr:hypothetical protein BGZ58_009287 [Dissophora ornata]KAI8602039.1 hypothetical protein EDD21DRAFT_443201 [Dissophora ornata]
MHQYQPIPGSDSSEPEVSFKVDSQQLQHQLPPTGPNVTQPQHLCQSKYPPLRKAWVILSLPLAVAILISTSVYCLSNPPILLTSEVQALREHHGQVSAEFGTDEAGAVIGEVGLGFGGLMSSPWPQIPQVAAPGDEDGEEQEAFEKESSTAQSEILKTGAEQVKVGDNNDGELGEIEIVVITVEKESPTGAVDLKFGNVDSGDREGYGKNGIGQDGSDDSNDDDDSDKDVDHDVEDEDEIDEIAEEIADLVEMVENVKDDMNAFPDARGSLEATIEAMMPVDLQSTQKTKRNMDDMNEVDGDNDDNALEVQSASTKSKQDEKGENPQRKKKGKAAIAAKDSKPSSANNSKQNPVQNQSQDQVQGQSQETSDSDADNGPILLCSSKDCLPALRDAILSRLSVQIHHVMGHLRNRDTLLHMMESTAPPTKDLLMVAQEEVVQQVEDKIVQALRDWVMEVRKQSGSSSSNIMPSQPTLSQSSGVKEMGDISAEAEGIFLAGDDEYESSDEDNADNFHMAGINLEDADDDDEDHENETHGPSISKSKKPAKKTITKRDTENNSNVRETFLPADKNLMRQEWSRWIAQWVHHTKILILSHTLATQTLNDMNRVAVSGGMVTVADQRHWSWNLDKGLAVVMVASEMICGAPSSLADTKRSSEFLSSLSMQQGNDITDAKAQKTAALALNAQKCIEDWNSELEGILQRTASTV